MSDPTRDAVALIVEAYRRSCAVQTLMFADMLKGEYRGDIAHYVARLDALESTEPAVGGQPEQKETDG